MKLVIKYGLILLLLFSLPAMVLAESSQKRVPEKTVTINLTLNNQKGTLYYNQFEAIYTPIFAKLGYKFQLQPLQAARALVAANSGTYEGDAGRRWELDTVKQYPNLIRVDESAIDMLWEAYSTNKTLKINSWEDLRAFKGNVAYQRGYLTLDALLPQYVSKNRIIINDDDEQNCKMLMAGRIDLAIGIVSIVKPVVDTNPEWKKHIYSVGIVGKTPLYPYINKKYAHLVPKILEELRAMKKDGTHQRIIAEEERKWKQRD